jgi:sulfoxide reductase heme-binding subunit YedZ
VANTLGANPAEALIRSTGDWTLRFAVPDAGGDPAAPATGWHGAGALRRMLGLFAFFYACCTSCACLAGHGAGPGRHRADIAKRPFILVGTLPRCC